VTQKLYSTGNTKRASFKRLSVQSNLLRRYVGL